MNSSHENDLCRNSEQKVEVWKNGSTTSDADKLPDEIERLSGLDATLARQGDLRTIFTRKEPFARKQFMQP